MNDVPQEMSGTVTRCQDEQRISLGEFVIIVPVFDDWHALGRMLEELDRVCVREGLRPGILVLDDASNEPMRDLLKGNRPRALASVSVLHLRRNLGHQRAIAVGLAYVEKHTSDVPLVVMDGDGEDSPEDVPRLLAALRESDGRAVVFAERRRRMESIVFRLCYSIYRFLHFWLTGISVRVGNFSAISRGALDRLVVTSELWSHYAAAVFRSRIPYSSIPTDRARRLAGKGRMRFVSLVAHGLSALAVHGEVIGVRMLVACLPVAALAGLAVALAVTLRISGVAAIGDELTWGTGVLLVVFLQLILLTAVFTFLTLGSRANLSFVPTRDYSYFVRNVERLFPADQRNGPTPQNGHLD